MSILVSLLMFLPVVSAQEVTEPDPVLWTYDTYG